VKPLKLEFTNIRSYQQFGPVSFEERSLVGILGDTGAGKSTILEALCLALYGQSSWQGGAHEDLMADGAPHMSVDLTFEHGGHTWRVQRTYYNNTRPTTASLRNLDTGLAVDNVRPVNAAIVSLLRMDFDAFRSAVLLPQGQFQKLLHSSRTERTTLLKGIFGVDRVEQVAELARTRAEQLAAVVSKAELARAGLPDDPAADAATADADGERYGALADVLQGRADEVANLSAVARTHREALRQLRQTHTLIAGATDSLTSADAVGRIAAAAIAAEKVSDQAEQCRTRTEAARQRERDAHNAIMAANGRGEGRSQVDAAIDLLATVPRRAGGLAEHALELHDEQRRIDAEAGRIAKLRTTLAGQQKIVAGLEQTADDAEEAVDKAAKAADRLRDATVDILTVAASVRAALAEQRVAEARIAELVPAIQSHQKAMDDARTEEEEVAAALAMLRRTAAAASAAAGLHPGDDCPVCARKLVKDWRAPDLDAAAQIDAAESAVGTARAKCEDAGRDLQQTQAALQAAEDARRVASSRADDAREQLGCGLDKIAAAAAGLAAGIDAGAVNAAVEQAASPDAETPPPREVAATLCAEAAAHVATLRKQAQAARTDAVDARARLNAELVAAEQSEADLGRARKALESSRGRWQNNFAELTGQLRALPAPVRAQLPEVVDDVLPDWLADGDIGPLAAAIGTAHAMSAELTAHEDQLKTSRAELDDLTKVSDELRTQHEQQVARPLRDACRTLSRAAAALSAVSECDVELAQPAAPADESDPAGVQRYLREVTTALADADTALEARITQLAEQAEDSFTRAVSAWRAALAAAAEADDQHDTAETEPADEDVLTASAVVPVKLAAELTRHRAQQAREEADRARAAIERAATLDEAIAAGQARASALRGLRAALSRSKFPAYLVSRRTEVLLGLASDLFGRLSNGEFGFAEDFQVVVRRSGSVRDPKTLSGGETFLASLSLALSLVELYSRAGGRLGALFLDEGFGALDMASLSAALDALSAETGGDKLVAVISHLHAVAEAVTDVLWVSKHLGTSSVSWMDSAQIEALVAADAEAGLLV